MANKNGRKILISLFIGVVVGCFSLNTFSALQQEIKEKDQLIEVMKLRDKQIKTEKYNYLVAIRDINAGETISKEDIMLTSFNKKYDDAISSTDAIIGNVPLRPLKSGQVLTNYIFTGVIAQKNKNIQGLREGYRALTLSTANLDGMSAEMKVGSLIDVFSKNKTNNIILSKVKILSLEPKIEKTDKPIETEKLKNIPITQAKTVTFEVKTDKIEDFVEIYSSGKILLVMRPIGDDTVIVKKQKTEQKSKQTKKNYTNTNIYGSKEIPDLPISQIYEAKPIEKPTVTAKSEQQNKNVVEIIEAGKKTQIKFE